MAQETHERCRKTYSDTDLHSVDYSVECILSAGHHGSHLGKDPQGQWFRWTTGAHMTQVWSRDLQDWETR
jgi:hypothetical protein